ncbi:MAG TPA: prolyl oligopeptidase family serine peptidase, partial [Massilibacterium sp.]|nr:prolyl oligopeptidase family serine peptidase [Massilibacterium sp.]
GVDFAKSSQADPAGAEFDDIVDGIDAFVDAGIADPERIGVTGGSYGGYATGWMSTRYTDRFAAGAVSEVNIYVTQVRIPPVESK